MTRRSRRPPATAAATGTAWRSSPAPRRAWARSSASTWRTRRRHRRRARPQRGAARRAGRHVAHASPRPRARWSATSPTPTRCVPRLAECAETHGPIDLLINNAAQDPGVRLADITEDDFRHTFDVNFFAPVAATLAVLPAMLARGRGIIVNVSSDGGRLPSPGPGRLPVLEGGPLGVQRVDLLPPRHQGSPCPRGLSGLHGHRARARGAAAGACASRPADHPQRGDGVTRHSGAGGGTHRWRSAHPG